MSINLLEENLGIIQRQKQVLKKRLKSELDINVRKRLEVEILLLKIEENNCLDRLDLK